MRSTTQDHPRVCGEHEYGFSKPKEFDGSPPRLRGARHSATPGGARNRITPAFAGSTGSRADQSTALADHPRVCGEHLREGSAVRERDGSPPRLRGAPALAAPRRLRARITPAFAGSTAYPSAAAHANSDHPRVCGEHNYVGVVSCVCLGSPPRLRGAPERLRQARQERGITPALAGSTCSTVNETMLKKDHPRVCGEHPRLDSIVCTAAGSPPRLRGARTGYWVCAPKIGITPAFAGSTGICATAASAVPDHPRVCGEHLRPVDPRGNRLGSPPRLRGAPRTAPQAPGECRITPAFAGSTAQ